MKAFDYLAVRLSAVIVPLLPLALACAHTPSFGWVFH